MKFRHTLYPSPIVHTASAGSAAFEGFSFETEDENLIAALKKDRFVEVVEEPAEEEPAPKKRAPRKAKV